MKVHTTRLQHFAAVPLIGLLRVYRAAVSPAVGPACRFEPTCSVYAEQAIRRFGPFKGAYLALRRILRCHPFSRGGLDPVPATVESTPGARTT